MIWFWSIVKKKDSVMDAVWEEVGDMKAFIGKGCVGYLRLPGWNITLAGQRWWVVGVGGYLQSGKNVTLKVNFEHWFEGGMCLIVCNLKTLGVTMNRQIWPSVVIPKIITIVEDALH